MQFVSPAILPLTGHAPEEFLRLEGLRYGDLMHPDDRETVEVAVAEAVAAGTSFTLNYRICHRDGGERHVLGQGAAVGTDPDGTSVLEGYIADVTAQHSLKERLKATEAEFRALFESAPGCYLVLTPKDFTIAAVSEAYLAATRTTREQLLDRALFDMFPGDPSEPEGDGVANLRRSLERVVETRRADAMAVQRYPIPRPAHEGGGFEERFWSPLNSPVMSPDGRLAYIIHRVVDVSDYVRSRNAVPTSPLDTRTVQVEADIIERGLELQRANDHLRVAQQRIYDTFESAALGIAMFDRDGLMLLLNRAVCELLGTDEAALLSTPFMNTVVPVDREALAETMTGLVEDPGLRRQHELRVKRSDGSERWVRARLSAVRSADGPSRHLMAVLEDITEARAAEARARRNAALLRIGGQMSRVGGWAANLSSSEVEWSDEIFEILEFPPGNPPPLDRALEMYPDEWRPKIVAALEGAARGEPFDIEMEIVTHRGRRLWVRAMGEPERDGDGRAVRVIGAFQDLTDVKAAAIESKQLADRYHTVLEATQSGIWEWDLTTDEVLYSERYRALLGYDEEQFPSTIKALRAVIHPDDAPEAWDATEAHLTEGQPFNVEYRLRCGSGEYRWFNALGAAVRDETGTPVRMVGSILDVHDRRTAEAEVQRLADRLTTTFESITDALFTLDSEWRFVYLNLRAEDLLRRPREELLGRVVWDEYPAARGGIFETEYRQAMATGRSSTFTAYYPEPLNRWYGISAYPSEQGLTIYFRDITDERSAAEAIRVSEERFRLLSQATNDAIWDWDLRTDALWWNEGYETLFGRSRAEVSPTITSWSDYIHPEDSPRVLAEVHGIIDAGGIDYSGEYRYLRADGTYAWVIDRGHIIRNDVGEPVRMIGGMTDLTERVRAEARVAEQAALLDEATDAILVRDLEHRVTFWNRGAEAIYGWSRDEAMGQPIWQLLYKDPASFHDATAAVLECGRWSGELEHRTKSGETRTMFGRWTLMRDRQGEPQSVLAINSDVTEQRRIERQFLRSQRLESIGTLAGGIAHDLNNVLTPILMSIELLRLELPSEDREELIATIERSTKRGADMVRQVLAFARGVEGQRTSTCLTALCRDVVKIASDTFPKNICVVLKVEEPIPPIDGDATQLHQVLLNLCLNARDAMPRGGDLRLTVRKTILDPQYVGLQPGTTEGPHVVVSIEDNGEGMTADVLDKIFEPFFTTKEIGNGTGLGLSTSQAIIQSHGGFIRVYSDLGRGTRFHVYLPVQEHAADSVDTEPTRDLPRGQGELVLVVDDEASVRKITQQTLEAFGYRVVTAQNGAKAISIYAVRQHEISVVLTDMMMPVMDGPALIEALQWMQPSVRIIASSGLNANGRVAKATDAGIKHFLPKPYTAEKLLQMLRKVLAEIK